jgi:hypothetical protein
MREPPRHDRRELGRRPRPAAAGIPSLCAASRSSPQRADDRTTGVGDEWDDAPGRANSKAAPDRPRPPPPARSGPPVAPIDTHRSGDQEGRIGLVDRPYRSAYSPATATDRDGDIDYQGSSAGSLSRDRPGRIRGTSSRSASSGRSTCRRAIQRVRPGDGRDREVRRLVWQFESRRSPEPLDRCIQRDGPGHCLPQQGQRQLDRRCALRRDVNDRGERTTMMQGRHDTLLGSSTTAVTRGLRITLGPLGLRCRARGRTPRPVRGLPGRLRCLLGRRTVRMSGE